MSIMEPQLATRFRLNAGGDISIPAVGLGTCFAYTLEEQLKGYMQVKTAVLEAIKMGYRHFDTSCIYGTQVPIGEALQEAMRQGLVSREEVFVTSKLWCDDHDPEDVQKSMENTLRSMHLDYVDLYLIHWPVRLRRLEPQIRYQYGDDDFLPLDLQSTWMAMEKLKRGGYAKAIGVSNFSSKKIKEILKYAIIPPSVNQVEMHPGWQQKDLRQVCKEFNIHVSAWSPLAAPGNVYGSRAILDHPILKDIAHMHNRTTAQVALRWAIEQGVSVIPKSFNEKRMKENLKIFDFHLTDNDHKKISTIPQNKLINGQHFCNTLGPYTSIQELWDGEI